MYTVLWYSNKEDKYVPVQYWCKRLNDYELKLWEDINTAKAELETWQQCGDGEDYKLGKATLSRRYQIVGD